MYALYLDDILALVSTLAACLEFADEFPQYEPRIVAL